MKTIRALPIAAAAALAASPLVASAEASAYAIDPTHTFVTFEASHFGTSTVRGRFDKKEGTVTLDRAAKTGSAKISIDLTSVTTGVPRLDKHLQEKDFFDAEQYKTAEFTSTKFVFDGDKPSSIEGTLALLGKTLPVTLKTVRFNCYQSPMIKREVCGGDFEATIQRSAWGMNFGLPNVGDPVHLLIQIEAAKQ